MARRRGLPTTVIAGGTYSPASRREMVVLGVYFAAVLLATDALNVRPGIEVMTVAVTVAALGISRTVVPFLRDWWFFLLGLLLWNLSGPIAADSPFPWHLTFMLNVDRGLFLGHQPVQVVQQALWHPGHVGFVDWLTTAVYNLHLPEPFVAGYLLWRLNRVAYLRYAAAVLILLVVGYVTFIVFPAVPPWLAAQHLVHLPNGMYLRVQTGGHVYLPGVMNLFGPTLAAHPLPFHGTPIFYVFRFRGDPVAAFPSEHAALPLIDFLSYIPAAGRSSAIWLVYIAAVLFSIVYLGEHWITDAIAGWVYGAVIVAGVRYATRPGGMSLASRPRYQPRPR